MTLRLTLQIHDTAQGWLDAAELTMRSEESVQIDYEIDYASQHIGRRDLFALSVTNPVSLDPRSGAIPGYLIDLVPQGNVLKRLIARHGIHSERDFRKIFASIPLASPGNIRIKEAWEGIESERPSYTHKGFEQEEIVRANLDFLTYMEEHGAPVGGTSGAAGGAPKFLLREDANGRFHADGYLDDAKTSRAWLVKFPFTDSQNSKLLLKVEKAYYDVLTDLGLQTADPLEWMDDVLFIPRFDRVRGADQRLYYFGLESFYSAHGINSHGIQLYHEDNLLLIARHSTEPQQDIIEYLKRDLTNQALANTDNHGRNWSFLKSDHTIRLSPIYDVTAMKFFEGDFIVPLTRWKKDHLQLSEQCQWLEENSIIESSQLRKELTEFANQLQQLPRLLEGHGVDGMIIKKTLADRDQVMRQCETL